MITPLWVDLLAVPFGAVTGALAARRHGFDIAGVLFLAVLCGLGGSLLRDTLLQAGTPVALTQPWLLPAALGGGLLGSLVGRAAEHATRRFGLTYVLLDGMCLALFAVVGTDRARALGLPPVSCVLVGVVAGTGGAIARDVIVNEQPELLLPGSLYAVAASIGCGVFMVVVNVIDVDSRVPAAAIAVAVVLAIRVTSARRGWSTLAADRFDLTPRVPRRRTSDRDGPRQ